MIANMHFNPLHTAAPTADKSTIRLIFALAASRSMHMDHFDIKSAFIQERYRHDKPIYVKQHPKFDGAFMQPGMKGGILVKNLYGSPSEGYYYLKGVEKWLLLIGFSQCPDNPCLFKLATATNWQIIVSLTSDDFLIAASDKPLIDWPYSALNFKYKQIVKRLGFPTQYLGWTVTRNLNGDIKISQPNYVQKALHVMRMADCNGRNTPHVDVSKYHGPEETDQLIPQHKTKYQEVLVELRYIADCTRPDITFYVNKLSCATQKPTERH